MAPPAKRSPSPNCVGDTEILVYAHHVLVAAASRLGDYDDALTLALANLARCGPDVSAERTLTAYHSVAIALIDLGRYAEVPAFAEPAVELARRSGLGGSQGPILVSDWMLSLTVLGRWTEAEAIVTEFDDLLDHPSEHAARAVSWGTALILQGRLEEARPLIEQARAEFGPTRVVRRSRHPCRRHRDVRHRRRARRRCGGACRRDARTGPRSPPRRRAPRRRGITAVADRILPGSIGLDDGAAERARATATRWIEWLDSVQRERWRPPGLEERLKRERALAQTRTTGRSVRPSTMGTVGRRLGGARLPS